MPLAHFRNLAFLLNEMVMRTASDNSYFSARTFGLGERGAHRQPQAGSTVLPVLQIQTGSFGEPPTPSASDLTLALDQY